MKKMLANALSAGPTLKSGPCGIHVSLDHRQSIGETYRSASLHYNQHYMSYVVKG